MLTVDALGAGGAAAAGGAGAVPVLQSPSVHCAALLGVVGAHSAAAGEAGAAGAERGDARAPRARSALRERDSPPSHRWDPGGAPERGGGVKDGVAAAGAPRGEGRVRVRVRVHNLSPAGGSEAEDSPPAGTRFLEVRVRARAGGGGGAAGMAEGWVNARPPTHAVAVRVAGLEVRPARAASAQSRRAATASRVGCRSGHKRCFLMPASPPVGQGTWVERGGSTGRRCVLERPPPRGSLAADAAAGTVGVKPSLTAVGVKVWFRVELGYTP